MITTDSRATLVFVPRPARRCPYCRQPVTEFGRRRLLAVAVNVYRLGIWRDGYVLHQGCYDALGQPFGAPKPLNKRPMKQRGAKA